MFNGNDLTEMNLNNIYDLLSKEQMNHMNTLKTSSTDIEEKREKSIQKQLSLLNTI